MRAPRPLHTMLVLIALAAGWGTAPAQSLANLARKTRAERQRQKPAKKVYTNKDVQKAEGSVSSSRVPAQVQAAARPRYDAPVRRTASSPAPSRQSPGAGVAQGSAGTSAPTGPVFRPLTTGGG